MNIPEGARAARVQGAIDLLSDVIALDERDTGHDSHAVIFVSEIESPEAVEALGIYITGIVAGAVTVDLAITERYFGDAPDDLEQLRREVHRVIGASNELTEHFRDTRRNPWIAECFAHLLVMLARDEPGLCMPGRVWAMTVPHDKVSQQGLDLVAVYEDGDLPSLGVGESKASERWAADHLNAAVRLFREIDKRDRDFQIRVVVINSLEAHLPEHVKGLVPGMFWHDSRLYLPTIGYSTGSDFDPMTHRPQTFGTLLVPIDRRRCVAIPLANFHGFFNDVADSMRASVDGFAA